MAYGKIPGDWKECMEKSRVLAMIEPVTEGILQLFIQTVILYVVNGPGEVDKDNKPLDLTNLLYSDDWSKFLYMLLLLTSIISVGTSFVKVIFLKHS